MKLHLEIIDKDHVVLAKAETGDNHRVLHTVGLATGWPWRIVSRLCGGGGSAECSGDRVRKGAQLTITPGTKGYVQIKGDTNE